MKIAVAKGDGIGPEIMEVVIAIFNAAKVPMEYEMVDMGKWVFDKGFSNGFLVFTEDPYSKSVVTLGNGSHFVFLSCPSCCPRARFG